MGLAWEEAAGATEGWPERGPGLGGGRRSHRGRWPERGPGLAWEEAAGRSGQSRGLSYRMHTAMGPPPPLSGVPTFTLGGTQHTAQHSWQLGHPSLQKDSESC